MMQKVQVTFKQEQALNATNYEEVLSFHAEGKQVIKKNDWLVEFFWCNDMNEEVQIIIDYDAENQLVTFQEVSLSQKLYLMLPYQKIGEGYLKTIHGLLQWETSLLNISQFKRGNTQIWELKYKLVQDQQAPIWQKLTLEMEAKD